MARIRHNIRLSQDADAALRRLAQVKGLTRTAVMEIAIREMDDREQVRELRRQQFRPKEEQ